MDLPLMLGISEQKGSTLNYTTDFQRICRTCLAERVDLQSVFNDRVNEMLISFATIQIVCNDGLPSNICSRCLSNISLAYNFKQQAEHSDNMLREYISNLRSAEAFCVSTTDVCSNSSNTVEIKYVTNNYNNTVLNNSNIDSNIPNDEFSLQSNVELEVSKTENTTSQLTEVTKDSENEIDATNNFVSIDAGSDLSETEDLKTNAGFECCNCNIVFKDKKSLHKHKCPHLRLKGHVCAHCGKSFVQKARLIQHMKRHNEEKKHACGQCEKRFFNSKDLVIHQRVHTGEKPINCNTCGKKFADPRVLAKHVKIHTGERNFECEICQKRFIHSYTLTAHKRTHSGEKPFICATCGHACSTSTQLTVHMRSHTNERPYFCKLCPKRRNKCIVKDCKGPVEGGLIHNLPTQDTLRHNWLNIVNRPDLIILPFRCIRKLGVCGSHFPQTAYRHEKSSKLNIGAVPLFSNRENTILNMDAVPQSLSDSAEEEENTMCANTSPELCADLVLIKTKRTYLHAQRNIRQKLYF